MFYRVESRSRFIAFFLIVVPGWVLMTATNSFAQDTGSFAQDAGISQDATPPARPQPAGQPGSSEPDAEARRQWVRQRFLEGVTSRRLVDVIHRRVDEMTDEEVNRAFLREKKEQAEQQAERHARQQARATAKSRAARQAWGRALAFPLAPRGGPLGRDLVGHPVFVHPRGNVAFAPNIGWFPSGTQLSVGPNGIQLQTQRFHGLPGSYLSPHLHSPGCTCHVCRGGGAGRSQHRSRPGQQQPEIWYDGLRTRVGDPKPEGF